MKRLLLFLAFTLTAFVQAQLKPSVNPDTIKIGGRLTYILQVPFSATDSVVFPDAGAFKPFEVLKTLPVDTLKDLLVKKYLLTAWDSGQYVIPSVPVRIGSKILKTDSIKVRVAGVKVDTTKQGLYGYKAVVPAGYHSNVRLHSFRFSRPWLWVALIVLAGLLLLYLLKAKKILKSRETPLSPYEKFLREWENLETGGDDADTFYVKLTGALRDYLEETLHIPAKESVSVKLIELLRQYRFENGKTVPPALIDDLASMFSRADLAKFAKFKPYPPQREQDRQHVRKFVDEIQSVVDEINRIKEAERQAQLREERKRQRKKKIAYAGAGIVSAVLLAWGIWHFYGNDIAYWWETGSADWKSLPPEKDWKPEVYGSSPSLEVTAPVVLQAQAFDMPDSLRANVNESAFWKANAGKDQLFALSLDLKKGRLSADALKNLLSGLLAKNNYGKISLSIDEKGMLSGEAVLAGRKMTISGQVFDNGAKIRVFIVAVPSGKGIWRVLGMKILATAHLQKE